MPRCFGLAALVDRRVHHDLDPMGRGCELRLDRGAGRRVALRYPLVPHRVHLGEIAHIRQPDVGLQEFGLVGAGLFQQLVDAGEDLLGLLGDRGHRVVGDDAGEVGDAVMDDGHAHARADLDAFDAHGFFLLGFRIETRIEAPGPGQGEYGRAGRVPQARGTEASHAVSGCLLAARPLVMAPALRRRLSRLSPRRLEA